MFTIKKFSIFIFFILIAVYGQAQKTSYITGHFNFLYNDSLSFLLNDFETTDLARNIRKIPVINSRFSYKVDLTRISPILFYTKQKGHPKYYLEPGDSIHVEITSVDNRWIFAFTGKGALKSNIINEARSASKKVKPPLSMGFSNCDSVADYLDGIRFERERCIIYERVLDKHREQLSTEAYNLMKFDLFTDGRLREKFIPLCSIYKSFGLSFTDMVAIYDTTIKNSILMSDEFRNSELSSSIETSSHIYINGFLKSLRENRFETVNPSTVNSHYNSIKTDYTGWSREKGLFFLLKILARYGDKFSNLYEDYFSNGQYPENKEIIREIYERSKKSGIGYMAPDFTLTDKNGKKVSLIDLRGKTILIDFWFTGCIPCAKLVPELKKVEAAFHNNPDFAYVNISIDGNKERWLESLTQQWFTSGGGICLYTEGLGSEHPAVKSYSATFPSLFLINPEGRIVAKSSQLIKTGNEMIAIIKKEMGIN